MTEAVIGFELLLHSAKQDIKRKEDLLVLLVHHCLLKAGFKCAGIGEQWKNDEAVSEILPSEWNTSKEYCLKYKRDEQKFVLMSNQTDDVIVLNFTSPDQMKVTNVIFNIEDTVKAIDGNISLMLPTFTNVIQKITQEMVTPFDITQKVNVDTQTVEQKSSKVHLMEDYGSTFPVRPGPLRNDFGSYINSVGRRDLDPLAAMGGGGGMFFDPLRENRSRILGNIGIHQRLPRGAIPPGARFDPFGPPDNDIPGRPPPGYDDMFG